MKLAKNITKQFLSYNKQLEQGFFFLIKSLCVDYHWDMKPHDHQRIIATAEGTEVMSSALSLGIRDFNHLDKGLYLYYIRKCVS